MSLLSAFLSLYYYYYYYHCFSAREKLSADLEELENQVKLYSGEYKLPSEMERPSDAYATAPMVNLSSIAFVLIGYSFCRSAEML